jgi:ERCC4-type nuclease
VERVVYIVEGTLQASGNPHKTWNQLPVDTLESALVSTQVGNDFVVQRCATLRDTISFLKTLTRQLTARTDSITLRDDDEGDDDEEEEEEDNEQQDTITHDRALWEIGRWSEKVSKSGNLTITDVFAKQLLQVCYCATFQSKRSCADRAVVHVRQINGVSPAKAKAITDRYATPWKLAQAYGRCADEAERMGLLAQLTAAGRKLGPALSKRVHEVMWAAI